MDEKTMIRHSKRLSGLLRHDPRGLTMDGAGWVPVAEVLAALRLSRAELDEVVARNNKSRFAYDPSGALIRASQGHSLPVDLGLTPAVPPDVLYHGTVASSLDAIRADGLRPMGRTHVHLSPDVETATRVGARHGRPVVLTVAAGSMHADGLPLYVSENGVWLADHVPPAYLQ
ncbi:RNA 2'-phosphotransferase [Actinokineospora sp. UTMC 2448]|uniref:RNA 2'-phosphotransferase n=1 Tax=Actinokineospora sp. UTMC 2448 TaxID=2268449 RepID=UPI0021640E8C|nr:RNA 2'-phosphotransferase [Actinokineospora sp. UTMC 2448]